MDTLADALIRAADNETFPTLLADVAREVETNHRLYPNEVEPAVRVVRAMRRGARTILLAHPMQSGKTNIMRAVTHLLRELLPEVQAIYICANDQLDFRTQNRRDLAPHVELLNRTQRRKLEELRVDRPTVVFYDESHFGDGADMTIQQFLERHGLLDQSLAVFCGVSATPMTSLDCLDATVWADMAMLEAAGYNSPRLMLERGRLRQAAPMFETPSRRDLGRSPEASDVQVLTDNPALQDLEARLAAKRRDGYVLIRARRCEAEALRAYLEERWGARVYVVDWNQHNREFGPEQFFSQSNYGVVSVVLVQHKARMGTRIDTGRCHFMFEYSRQRRGASVDTIAQSFLGRACGFGKQDHDAVVYSRPDVARAYTLLMSQAGGGSAFASFCERHALRPAQRARVQHRLGGYALCTLEMFHVSPKDSAHSLRARCRAIQRRYGLQPGLGAVRTLSKFTDPARARMVDAQGRPNRSFAEWHCGAEPGCWSIVIFDRKGPARKNGTRVLGKCIILAVRGSDRKHGQACVQPSEESLHYDIRARRKRFGQMAFSFAASVAPMAAQAR